MAIGDMTALQRGDIVIERVNDHQGHTMIVTQRIDAAGTRASYRVAHCPGPAAATREELLSAVCGGDVADASLFAWRRTSHDVATRAADLALYWSTTHHTAYGELPGVDVPNGSRARGVARQYDHGRGVAPRFGFDALFRVFKWANRRRSGHAFSANRGTTCCSFVMACHQTASVVDCLHAQNARVQAGYEYLHGMRRPKLHHGEDVEGKALRSVSNVGSTNSLFSVWDSNPYGADRMWERLLAEISIEYGDGNDFWGPSLSDTLTEAMKLDAKFTFTMLLRQQLELPGSGWAAC